MARLVLASPAQIDRITRETHALWGGGLSYPAYRDLWDELGRSAWATKYARYHVWQDDGGRVLSSLKLYRPMLRVGTRQGRASVLGAVFTPSRLRRRGHAADALRAELKESERAGDLAALLFSDIGTQYYSRLGFRPLPAQEQVGRLPPAPEWLSAGPSLRPAESTDLPRLALAHEASSARRSLAVVRDREHWEFLWIRSRAYFSRAEDPGIQHDWRVAYRGDVFAGYVIAVLAGGDWSVREVGAADGEPRTMIEILRHAGALAYRGGARRVYGWLPAELVPGLEEWRLRGTTRRRAVPMVRLLDPEIDPALLAPPADTHIPFQDQF